MLRLLVIDAHHDFGSVLADLFDLTGNAVARYVMTIGDAHSVTEWAPDVAFVAAELLTHDSSDLRCALPSLRYIVAMTSARYGQITGLDCNRVVIKPFDVTGLVRELIEHLAVN